MGRIFLVDLHAVRPFTPYYICAACGAHISFSSVCFNQLVADEFRIFSAVINVIVAGPAHYIIGSDGSLLAPVHCVKCNILLGNKAVQVVTVSQIDWMGTFSMDSYKLLLRSEFHLMQAVDFQSIMMQGLDW